MSEESPPDPLPPGVPTAYPCDGVRRFRIRGFKDLAYSECYEFLLGMHRANCESAKKIGRRRAGVDASLLRIINLNRRYEDFRLIALRHEHPRT